MDYLEEKLAQYSGYEISEISLEYCAKYDNADDLGTEYRPMWCFTIDEYQSRYGEYSPRKIIYLDAQNGEMCCFDMKTLTMIF